VGGCTQAERARQGVHPEGANSMSTSGLVFRSDLVVTGKAISILIKFRKGVTINSMNIVNLFRAYSRYIRHET